MRVQHNIMAMGAYRNYTNNVSAMKKNLERLSSGYKINRAGDDAAGLAISEKMRAQITGLETAQKNAKDGISLVQTAEGALTEVHDMLNRMVELATQSANGTYDNNTDRYQLQKEMDQLKAEINRIADGANFNGIQLLDGSMDTSLKVTGEEDLFAGPGEKYGADKVLTAYLDGQLGNDATPGVFEWDLTNFEVEASKAGAVQVKIWGVTITVGTASAAGQKFTGADIAKAIVSGWASQGLSKFETDYGVKLAATMEGDEKVRFTMSQAPTKAWDEEASIQFVGAKPAYGDPTSISSEGDDFSYGNQAQGTLLKTITKPVDSSATRKYAVARLNIQELAKKLKDGSTLKIGDTTYVFALGANSKYRDAENVIDLTDIEQSEIVKTDATAKAGWKKIANRLTTAAQNNANFKVTAQTAVGSATATSTRDPMFTVYITEKEGGVDTKDYKLEGSANTGTKADKYYDADWSGFVMLGEVNDAAMGKGLSLQIGDTAESYNQLKVSISDCHTSAIGIDGISISDQESAQAAVDAIRAAINYVSDVRGTLGATQNRLDHTINNLSVMTENIQDAESTIRDTDIAEEMMAYTKNNILIQSAQAMLAQANQVPQGVLQLLQ